MLGIFLDIETTGLNAAIHRPIDIAIKIVDLCAKQVKESYQTVIKQPQAVWTAKDPVSIGINGFTWEEIEQGKIESLVAQEIIALFERQKIQRGSSVFICQNPAFDRGFFNQLVDVYIQGQLNWPYHWLDLASMYWTIVVNRAVQEQKPLPESLSLSKNDIAKSYHLEEEKSPHRAMNGVNHLIACYQAVLNVQFRELLV